MFGTAQKSEATTTETSNKKGIAYDLCRKVKQADGTEKLVRCGTVFIRNGGSGGVATVTGDDGQKHELAIFARKAKQPAAPAAAQPAAEPAVAA